MSLRLAREAALCFGTWLAIGWTIVCLSAAALVPQRSRPTFTATSVLVRLDVVVTDRNDRPIVDLRREEFEIHEGGLKQTIQEFEFVHLPVGNRSIDFATRVDVESEVASSALPTANARAFVVVLDEMTLTSADIIPVQRVIADFLRGLTPSDQVALTYIARSDLGQDFTNSAHRLLRAAENLAASIEGPKDIRDVMFVLRNVLQTLATAPQSRRAIVLIGRGWPGGVGGYELNRVFDLSRRTGIPIYTLDPAALIAPELGLEAPLEDQAPATRAALDRRRQSQQAFLRAVATNTGGRSFVNRWNLRESIRDMLSENGTYYVIGYVPTRYVEDGRFHQVQVKTTRPGLRVRARPGYISAARSTKPTDGSPLARLGAHGLAGGNLSMRGFAVPLSSSAHSVQCLLALDVSYPGVSGTQDETLDMAWVAIDPDGRILASGARVFRPDPSTPKAGPRRISIQDVLELPNRKLSIRTSISSRSQDSRGRVHLSLNLPLRKNELSIGPIVIGTAGEPGVLLKAAPGLGALPFDPTSNRVFSQGDSLRLFARLFGPENMQPEATLLLKRGEDTILELPIVLQSSKVQDAFDLVSSVALTGLATGEYWIDLNVRAIHGERRARATFEVR